MVQVLIYYPYLDGTSTSLIDTYYNLKSFGVDIECYVAVDTSDMKRNLEYIQTLKKSTPKDFYYKTILLKEIYNKNFNNLIMSFGIFRFVDKLPTNYNHLFLLDAGRIPYDYFLNNKAFINHVKKLKNVCVYGNRCNQIFFNFSKYKIWYHKFSKERFNFLKKLVVIQQTLTEDKRENTGNIKFDYMLSNELKYNRWREINGEYRENIGKMIFEFSALGKKVVYSPKNKNCDDGLTEYLALFGINDKIEQKIVINEEQLFDVLGMHENDILLNDIQKYEVLGVSHKE